MQVFQSAVVVHPSVLPDIRSVADPSPVKRKLFVSGLGPDTSSESICFVFITFSEIDEAVDVVDKARGLVLWCFATWMVHCWLYKSLAKR